MKAFVIILLLFLPTILYCDEKDMNEPLKSAKQQHESAILSLPGVVSVGIGKGPDGNPAIIVGLAGHNEKTEKKIETILKAFPVEIRIVGTIKKQSSD